MTCKFWICPVCDKKKMVSQYPPHVCHCCEGKRLTLIEIEVPEVKQKATYP